MRNFVLSLTSICVLLIVGAAADPAAPGPSASAPAAAPPPVAADNPDRMVCRTMDAKTGSRIGGRRECRTQREWDDIRHQNERELEKMQSRDVFVPH